jgi:hypothetical protein
MVSRLLSLSIVLLALFFAGVPAFACINFVPNHDCCPKGPCSLEASVLAPTNVVHSCCIADVAGSIAVGADDASGDTHKLLKRVDVPAIAVTSVVLPSVYRAGMKFQTISTTFSLNPSSALLYLSTGRLRL